MSISVVSRGLNSLDIFARGPDGSVYHKSYDGVTGWAPSLTGYWENLGGLTHDAFQAKTSPLTAVAWGPSRSRIDVFSMYATVPSDRGLNWGGIDHKFGVGSVWSPPGLAMERLGQSLFLPSAVSWGPDRLDLFGVGMINDKEGEVRHWWLDAPGATGNDWQGSESLGGIVSWFPRAISWGPGRLDIFVLGTDRQMYHKWYNGEWGPSFTDWQGLGGVLYSTPIPVSWASDRLDIFAMGADKALYHKWWNARDWGPSLTDWEGLDGGMLGEPSAVSASADRLNVFVTGTDGAMYHKWWDGIAWRPSMVDFQGHGGTLVGSPVAVSWGPNRIDVFAEFTDGAVHHKWADGPGLGADIATWGGWESLGIPGSSEQPGWRWCHKCQGMFYAVTILSDGSIQINITSGACPAGQEHDSSGSGNYAALFGEDAPGQQGNWRWCHKCQGMFFAGNVSQGACPAGQAHDASKSGHYATPFGESGAGQQGSWRWCHKCQGMFFAGNISQGVCPAGQAHDANQSGPYAELVTTRLA